MAIMHMLFALHSRSRKVSDVQISKSDGDQFGRAQVKKMGFGQKNSLRTKVRVAAD